MNKVYIINEEDIVNIDSRYDLYSNTKKHEIICSDYEVRELASRDTIKINGVPLPYVPELVINGVRVPTLKSLSKPTKYIINKGATILFWADGSKTVVKRTSEDEHNKRLAFLTAYFQKHCGLSKNQANKYLDSLMDEDELKDLEFISNNGITNLLDSLGKSIENVGKSLQRKDTQQDTTNKEEVK